MKCDYCIQTDNGPNPYVVNIEFAAAENRNFRTAIWTGNEMQMTLMCIPPCGEIGLEIHEDTDQLLRIEQGTAIVKIGRCRNQLEFQKHVCKGDIVFVPAGSWHNVVNMGRNPLKISSVYAPPKHRRGTVHRTNADAEKEEY